MCHFINEKFILFSVKRETHNNTNWQQSFMFACAGQLQDPTGMIWARVILPKVAHNALQSPATTRLALNGHHRDTKVVQF